ncbi:MAG: hypothetical protein AB7I48_04630 [Planctomycetaceae bacterium]
MFNSTKTLCVRAMLIGAVALSVSAAGAADPGLRLWQKQHPGSTPPAGMTRDGRGSMPQAYRSYSYAPAGPQTVRSFSYAPTSPQTVRSYSYAPSAPQTVRSDSVEPGAAAAANAAPACSCRCGH